LKSLNSIVIVMRPCKRCSSRGKTCTLGEASEKCVACVESGKLCDLAIPPSKLRRIHKERLRVRDAIREAETKLYRLQNQLRRLKDEEKEMVSFEWDIINVLEGKEESFVANSDLLFDVSAKAFQFLETFDWSSFVVDPLNLSGLDDVAAGKIVE